MSTGWGKGETHKFSKKIMKTCSTQMVVTIFAQKVIRVGDKHLVFLIAKKILPSKMEKIRFFQKVTPIFFFTDDI